MGQIPVSYEETKQFLSVTNRSQYTVYAFSPCVVIAGESGDDDQLYVHSVIDRDVDADFKGQLYLLAISGPADIPPGGSGRVSTDLPLIVSIKPDRVSDGIEESDFDSIPYFFFNYSYNYLRPSPDGRGMQYQPAPIVPDEYPYSLGYWHWVDSLQNRYFEISQFLDGETEALRKIRRGESVLVYLREIPDHWYRGSTAFNGNYYRQASGDAIEFYIGSLQPANFLERIADDADLDDYRAIEEPEQGLGLIANGFRYWYQRSMFQIEGAPRVAFTNYGLYEIEIRSTVEPVSTEFAFSRFTGGAQVSSLPPQDSSDNWRWTYEDWVMLVNRHDFDTAISHCPVDTIEQRQPFEVQEMSILQHGPSGNKFPYLWPVNRDGDAMATQILAGAFGTPLYNFPHFTTKFLVQIGRPAKLGSYKGMAKTVLEFRLFNRTAATTGSLRGYSIAYVKRLNSKVDVLE